MKRILAVIAGLVVLAFIVVMVFLETQDREGEKSDFQGDLEASGFADPNPTWEDEPSSNGSTESTLEAVVKVAGCSVELERARDESKVANVTGDRKIELYTLDEIQLKSGEQDVNFDSSSPTFDEVEQYLRENATLFPCVN